MGQPAIWNRTVAGRRRRRRSRACSTFWRRGSGMADMPDEAAEIESVTSDNPLVVRTSSAHGLKDQDEVKITGVQGLPSANGAFFVKVSGYDAQSFALYSDAQLTVAASAPG